MRSPWLALPELAVPRRPRSVVHESWQRARERELDPEHLPTLEVGEDVLADFRLAHPLAPVLPVIRKLLVRDAEGSGLLVAVGDEMGRLLWVEGDNAARRRAEQMRFVEGAGWSERTVGTSAPGTALELDHGIQIHDAEHFNRLVHGWSCTAVPVHDPETRRILGVIDITGDARAVDPHTLPLIEATAAAAEAELMVLRLKALRERGSRPGEHAERMSVAGFAPSHGAGGAAGAPRARRRPTSLHVLGRDTGELLAGDVTAELSLRHSEIVTVLAWHRGGLSASRLAELVYGEEALVTLRAEIVRLRRILDQQGTGIELLSRPYRLSVPLELDAHHVISLLDRGAHRVALAASRGPLLPASEAPGVEDIRAQLRTRLREAMLTDAAVDVMLDYAATEDGLGDAEVWAAALRLLPPRSPKRAGVVAHLEALEG
ncbi:GAF domain-containing protein [Herbiconiux sp. KACC 21604]|uniref:GAF domain-containing protein n=1 Tax=unclassified Herbiconiux TaxID=2618217 RepID=UPI001491D366|nr:GAF domain-containing protein [Herbiconiux sp. SALV-R1]QJU52334.1 GAF domain-containing protein [Herbiconiux sp. SALV-R1]WPO87190.1 GAF domain-containing protein [Herbiconiux sp. KACC 21604]